jgi:hypothetical protein
MVQCRTLGLQVGFRLKEHSIRAGFKLSADGRDVYKASAAGLGRLPGQSGVFVGRVLDVTSLIGRPNCADEKKPVGFRGPTGFKVSRVNGPAQA